jgi:integrase/recombinase XerD
MSVHLRKKSLQGGRKSYYLDIWHDGKRRYEFLNLYIVRVSSPIDKSSNEQVKELAESIRAKRELELQASDHDFIPRFKKNVDFLAYFDNYLDSYKNKDIRLVRGANKYFNLFIQERGLRYLPVKNIDEQLCKDFLTFLESKVHGETISNYFKKFKAVMRRIVKERLILTDVSEKVTTVKSDGLKKDVLNLEELDKLAKAKCNNDQVRRAFLFSANTGIRFCDVKELRWRNIDGDRVRFTQAKTENRSGASNHTIDLNKTALKVIGDRGKPEELIFTLPSHTGCLKSLKTWVKNAKIEKHITWHSARHSVAVNLLDTGTDVKTVAAILGHSGLGQVDKYLRIIDERKKQAVNRLPEVVI